MKQLQENELFEKLIMIQYKHFNYFQFCHNSRLISTAMMDYFYRLKCLALIYQCCIQVDGCAHHF